MFMERENNDEIEIDLLEVAGELWRHFWVIVLSMIVFGAAAFSYANFLITPLYHSEAKVYVNNSNLSVGSTSISLTDLNAAQSLVDTYIVILKSRPTLEDVIEKANVSYTYEQLESMISASSVDSTEVFSIVVEDADPEEACMLANTIVEVLPDHISDIVDGSSPRIVQYAVVPTAPYSPNVAKFLVMGVVLGLVLSCGIIILMMMMDKRVKSPEVLTKRYDIPILASVPDLTQKGASRSRYGNYGEYGKKAGKRNG